MAKYKPKAPDAVKTTEEKGIYVYLGPSIKGVIQNGTIFRGTRTEINNSLSASISIYPKITRLIVKDTGISEAKEKLRIGGNSISAAYAALTTA